MFRTHHLYQPPEVVIGYLNKLFATICIEKEHCQLAAARISEKRLRQSLLLVAQECNQYAAEIKSQIEMMGGKVKKIVIPPPVPIGTIGTKTSDIFKYCLDCEKRILKAYRDVLNESVEIQDLKKILRYQLKEFRCAFLNLKLLAHLYRPPVGIRI